MNFRELLEVLHERNGDVVQRAVRLALACEIDVRDAVGILNFAISCEAVQKEGKPLVAFHIAGTFEEFIEHGADEILCGGDKARDRHLIRKLPVDQAVVIREVNVHFDE